MGSDGVHLTLTRDQASSWELAATIILRKWCRIERPVLPQVGRAAQELKKVNKKHLEAEGAYSVSDPVSPQQADHRAFSRIRPEVEIYVPPPVSICPPPETPPSEPTPPPQATEAAEVPPLPEPERLIPLVDPTQPKRIPPRGTKPVRKEAEPRKFEMP